MSTATKFRVIHKKASASWGTYRRIAIVEVTDPNGPDPRMISTRARNCERVVRTWEKLNVGTTSECAFQKGLREANAVCEELNSGS